MTARTRKRLYLLGIAIAVCATADLAALFFSANVLLVEDAPAQADAIVVLGGETVYRPERALELYQQRAATNVIISGEGDCEGVRITLEGKGVPAMAIQLECESRTTRENAKFTVPLLRSQNAKRVIIVTSWFHSRRALHCFRHYAPEIEFISRPTNADLPRHHWPSKWERKWVLTEYIKVVYYRVRFGISSW
jgi:uncharacterized SAM-binding protein YcdF (DUF218 family)